MNYETISVEETHQGEVTEIIMGPPPANVLSAKMMKEIEAQLDIDEKLPAKKLIIFTGQGKHFCFGASVEEHKPEHVNDMLPAFHNLIGRLIDCPIPTLAKVTGMCLGGGFELALACTLIFADETAKFSVPEITRGVFPPPAASLLPFKCADQAASQIILSGEQFPAEKLARLFRLLQNSETQVLGKAVPNRVGCGWFWHQIRPRKIFV